jgi:hypothetical protein
VTETGIGPDAKPGPFQLFGSVIIHLRSDAPGMCTAYDR